MWDDDDVPNSLNPDDDTGVTVGPDGGRWTVKDIGSAANGDELMGRVASAIFEVLVEGMAMRRQQQQHQRQ